MPQGHWKLPPIYENEDIIRQHTGHKKEMYRPGSNIDFSNVGSCFGIALHMHQPTIPASTPDIRAAGLISNLQYMMEHQHIHDNHNAPVFLWCYRRMSDFIRQLVKDGRNPRVMLDYSGNLLWAFRQMGEDDVIKSLALVTTDSTYHRYVEWVGTMWSHAVVPSTPVPDIRLHIRAWQKHFASIFGYNTLSRVKGFSAPEMHLPIHPDLCHEYVKILLDCGYEWLIVQEHTIENLDGSAVKRPDMPHRLVAKNSLGRTAEITVLIKTQGSDTKLVGQMQPYYEAKTKKRQDYCGRDLPPYVIQISDGENGGVMMNEFPAAYMTAFQEIGASGTVSMNGSEYLEFVRWSGVGSSDFTAVQPVSQHRIWEFVDRYEPQAADMAVEKAKKKYGGFNLDKGSWTNDKNWVKGYEDVLDPINRLSVEFHRRFDGSEDNWCDPDYKEALLYLLLSQTSCFRYWGSGIWTEYAKEICRRGTEALKKRS